MKRILLLIQFLPLSIFLAVARAHGFMGNAWPLAFKLGALAAALEIAILLPILRSKISRLIAGANLFLIVGGLAFFLNNHSLISLIDYLREAGVIIFVGIVCIVAILFVPTGVFEKQFSKGNFEKKFSIYFLIGIFLAFLWSFSHRGDPMMGGVAPFIFLIITKQLFQRKLLAL